jgi:hypothetical protein
LLLVAGIHEEPVKPDLEVFRITEPGKLAPGQKKSLLDGVLGSLDIAKDPIRDGVATVAVEVDEFSEGDVIAGTRPFDQPRPHLAVSLRHPQSGRFGD